MNKIIIHVYLKYLCYDEEDPKLKSEELDILYISAVSYGLEKRIMTR